MNLTQLADAAVARYPEDRRRMGASRDRRASGLRPVMQATGWVLAGAAVGSLALMGLLWAFAS
jgi:hypothetical protein